jgi:hypothetical protein
MVAYIGLLGVSGVLALFWELQYARLMLVLLLLLLI